MRADQLYDGILGVPLVELLRGPVGLDVIQSELYLVSYTELFCDLSGPVSIFLLYLLGGSYYGLCYLYCLLEFSDKGFSTGD